MSPRLVPFTPIRFVVPSLLVGAVACVAWWIVTTLMLWLDARGVSSGGAVLSPDAQGQGMIVAVAGVVAAAQIAVEGRFERTPAGGRVLEAVVAALLAVVVVALPLALAGYLATPDPDAPPLALAAHLGAWIAAGLGAGLGPLVARAGRHGLDALQRRWEIDVLQPPPPLDGRWWVVAPLHAVAGLLAGLVAALAWYGLGRALGDLHLASAAGCWLLGAIPGALVWTVPDRLYVGWLRVLRGRRAGWRVPVDAAVPALSERFVGGFPAGMDLWIGEEEGVAELHASVVALGPGRFTLRGLSRDTLRVHRTLERIDLAYAPSLPAPLQTRLRHGDVVPVGSGDVRVEFLVLSREGDP